MYGKKMFNMRRVWTIGICRSTLDTKQATYAMKVSASGKMFQLHLIFKGMLDAQIAACEFPSFLEDRHYNNQKNT